MRAQKLIDQPKAPESKPGAQPDSKDDLKSLPMAELQAKLGSSPDGLSHVEAAKGPTQYGPNELEEKKANPVLKCLTWETNIRRFWFGGTGRVLRNRRQPHTGPGASMTAADELVFLLDCDDTLLDNDRVQDDLDQRYPARHYVMVDDKPRILAAMKKLLGDRLTTVFPRQGHYALDPHNLSTYPPADLAIERIGDLRHFNLSMLVGPARGRDRGQEAT